MADENKNYTSKIKIGNVIYYVKDNDAQAAIAVLNGNKGVAGSVLTSVRDTAKDAIYAVTYTYETKKGTPEAGDYVLVDEDYILVTSENAATYSESTAYTRNTVTKTIAEAIAEAANSIGNLTVNEIAPDANDAIVLDTTDIKREDGITTIESALSSLDSAVETLNGSVSTTGSVKNTVKTEAKNADYSAAVEATYKTATEYDSETTYYSDDQGTVADPQPSSADDISSYYVVDTPATPAMTIGQAIAANSTAIGGLDTRVTSLEETRTTLLGNDTVTGSIDNRIKTQAGDATTKLTPSGNDTTITAAIQSLQTQVNNVNKGQFKIIDSVDLDNNTITIEDGDTPVAASASDLGYIYLVSSDSADEESVYTEYIVINTGTELVPTYTIEKLGDTKLDIAGYATEEWVTANAKNGSYRSAVAATYKVATEYDESVTYYSDINGTVADPQPSDDTDISSYYVIDTPAVSAQTIAQAITANTTNIANEVTRATTAEGVLDGKIDTLEAATVKTVNNVAVTSGTNNVVITSGDINHTYNTTTVTYSEASPLTFAGDTLYKKVGNEYEEVPQDDWESFEGTLYARIETVTPNTVTVSNAIESLKTSVTSEASRATNAEDALDARIDTLEGAVNGATVHSVNGKAATAENEGVIVLKANDINYQDATTATVGLYTDSTNYYKADLSSTTFTGTADTTTEIGNVYIGKSTDVFVEEGTWYAKSSSTWYEVTSLSSSAIVLGDEVTDSDTITELEGKTTTSISYITYTTDVAAVTVKDSLDNILSRLSVMSGTKANALTSVNVKSGTGTWSVDGNDPEQLNWSEIELETTNATFLASSAE